MQYSFLIKHKIRLENMLEECRKIEPGLPSWNSLSTAKCFIDDYGFKYEKKNEFVFLHYVCQQLNSFYINQSKLEQNELWESRVNAWQRSFSITVIQHEPI